MIMDNLKNAPKYTNMGENFVKAFQFLTEKNLDKLELGRHEIDGDNVYANVQEYDTKLWENTNWETHGKYIDIQCVIQGKEKIGWCDALNLTVKENRLESDDVIIYDKDYEPFTDGILSAGEFAVYFPTDAHRPCGCYQQPALVKKIVIKVKY